jgi:hypothetical protein
MTAGCPEPGIYFDMPEDVYHAARALSCSGIKQLSVSPLNYWHCNLNPDRDPPGETYPQRFGKAVHCRLLEPARFRESYALELCEEDMPEGTLFTVEQLKAFCAENGLPTSSRRKQELIDRIMGLRTSEHDGEDRPVPPIWDVVRDAHAAANGGKVLLTKDEAAQLNRLEAVVEADPSASTAFTGGMPEVSFFVRDPETGVMLKARMDYVRPRATIDLKTFSNSRGKPTDRAVFDAIFHERYYVQAVFYHTVRELARQQLVSGEIATHGNVSESWLKSFCETPDHGFGFVFVESAEPFDLRTVLLRRAESERADPNVYWVAATVRIADATALYAECLLKYGDGPWREPLAPHILDDTDLPQLMFT